MDVVNDKTGQLPSRMTAYARCFFGDPVTKYMTTGIDVYVPQDKIFH
jgi:hypothetical protein